MTEEPKRWEDLTPDERLSAHFKAMAESSAIVKELKDTPLVQGIAGVIGRERRRQASPQPGDFAQRMVDRAEMQGYIESFTAGVRRSQRRRSPHSSQ